MLLLLASMACVDAPCAGFEGNTLYVYAPEEAHRQGTNPRAFTSIREALGVAEPGTGICIGPGTWTESLNVLDDDVALLGAGADRTFIEPISNDPRGGDTTGIRVGADGLLVKNLTIRDATRGISVSSGHDLRLEGVELRTNGTGLLATEPDALTLDGVLFSRNTTIGALVRADHVVPEVNIRDGAFIGNGDLESSEVGGLYSDRDVDVLGTRFSDNAGNLAADMYVEGHLKATRITVDRPAIEGGAPRIVVRDGLTWRHSQVQGTGATLVSVSCRDMGVEVENLVVESHLAGDPLLSFDDCTGRLVHATFLDHSGGQPLALSLTGEGLFEVSNSAFIGVEPLEGELAREGVNFVGTKDEAGLSPTLLPKPGSPLVDQGEELGVIADIQGRPRPVGPAPDVGAFELY
jgi:hypothetical protein